MSEQKIKVHAKKKLKLYDNPHSLSHYPKVDVNQPSATYQIIPSLVKTINVQLLVQMRQSNKCESVGID